MANRACNLECVSDHPGDDVVEFVGPVKIILVNQPKHLYKRKRFEAGFIVLSHMLMGASIMMVLYYTLSYEKRLCLAGLHVFLCTAGLQICMPLGILSLHTLSGSSAPVKPTHRQCEHAFIHFLGIFLTILGAIASFFCGYFQFSIHCILGCTACALALFNAINGFLIYDYSGNNDKGLIRKIISKFHSLFGIVTLILSSACFISGLIKPTFTKWTPLPEMSIFSVLFCIYYTGVILFKPIKELFTF
ncbi:uncharacterized protein LOC123697574 [Colias croceus]|uniref:uncharacterized protein LOC123697574 n=1 Tax=Colias crocea TaxID=72248 RepID=UPI001E27EF69|nr:uncharacterized protein LOC123697574 [Colias croceus]